MKDLFAGGLILLIMVYGFFLLDYLVKKVTPAQPKVERRLKWASDDEQPQHEVYEIWRDGKLVAIERVFIEPR